MAKPKWLAPLLGALAAAVLGSGSLRFVSPLPGRLVVSQVSELGRRPDAPSVASATSSTSSGVGSAVLCAAALVWAASKAHRSVRKAIPNPHVVPVVDLSGKKIGEEEICFKTFSRKTANYVVFQAYHIWRYQQMPFTEYHARRSDVKHGKKLWKNKGVGKARMGSLYSPLFGRSSTNKNPHGIDNKRKKKLPRMRHTIAISTVLQSKWRCMKIVEGLEDIKEPRYYDLCQKLRAWTGQKPCTKQTLMITRSGYGKESPYSGVPFDFSSPLYMAGRLIDNFSMRRPRDMDAEGDGLHQALLGRRIVISREAFFDLTAKFDAHDGWAFKKPDDILVEELQKIVKEYPYDRQAEFQAAMEVPKTLSEREFWAKEIREKSGDAAVIGGDD